MSSSSPRRLSWLAAGALAVVAGALVWSGPVGAATTLDVVAVVPGDALITMIVGVDPPPSLAPAHGTIPAATAAAAPPEEPPGVWSVSHGLRAGPYSSGSVMMPFAPISGVLVLPKMTSPASSQRCTTVACSTAGRVESDREPPLVG